MGCWEMGGWEVGVVGLVGLVGGRRSRKWMVGVGIAGGRSSGRYDGR